jgi:hypothetical protein
MKLFALHSPAFSALWQPFRASVLQRTSFELVEAEIPSRFDNCSFGQERYLELLRWLVIWRINLIRSETEPFVTCGVDSEFYGDPVPMLLEMLIEGDADLIGADDNPKGWHKLCSCFYCIKPSPKMLALYQKVLDDRKFGYGPGKEPDDPILNEYRDMVHWKPLPHNLFWNTLCLWNIGDALPPVPKEVMWVHANYITAGIAAKIALLDAVRKQMSV